MRTTRIFNASFLGALLLLAGGTARAAEVLSLDALLERAFRDSEASRVVDLTLAASEMTIASRDLVLSPTLTSEIAQVNDDRATLTTERLSFSRFLDVTLAKPFATGTTASITAGLERAESSAFADARHVAAWELGLTQSLWRDSFGRATRLRHEEEAAERRASRLDATLSRQRIAIDMEAIYWDLALAYKETEVHEGNLKRSEALEIWMRDRIRRSAAETSDLLQVQALTTSRRLELVASQNRLESLRNRLREVLPGFDPTGWRPDTAALERDRVLEQLVAPGDGTPASGVTPERLEAQVGKARSDQAQTQSRRVDDALRPRLDLVLTHGRNGVDPQFGEAWTRATGPQFTATKVGVQFSVDLDGGLKGERRRAAQAEADAAAFEARFQERSSTVGWEELGRRMRVHREQVQRTREFTALQQRKAQEERVRYERGRTTSFQAISFEVEAANAEVLLYRLLAEVRKTESQARAFVGNRSSSL